MEQQPVFVGLDYHQESVQVCVLDAQGRMLGNRRVANRCGDIIACVGQSGAPSRVAIEACTGAADLAEELIERAGWSVDMAHPGYVQRMKANPDKTDFSDAQMLADLTRVGYLPKVWLAPQTIRELRRLVRHRQQLVDTSRATKLRLRGLLRGLRLSFPGSRLLLGRLRCGGKRNKTNSDRHFEHTSLRSEEAAPPVQICDPGRGDLAPKECDARVRRA